MSPWPVGTPQSGFRAVRSATQGDYSPLELGDCPRLHRLDPSSLAASTRRRQCRAAGRRARSSPCHRSSPATRLHPRLSGGPPRKRSWTAGDMTRATDAAPAWAITCRRRPPRFGLPRDPRPGHRAGNGLAGGPVGVAPDADLVFVHLADRRTGGLANLGDSVGILEAVDFIARTAGRRPWMINVSVGRHGGPTTDRRTELALDAMLRARPGRFVVQGAGNYFRLTRLRLVQVNPLCNRRHAIIA